MKKRSIKILIALVAVASLVVAMKTMVSAVYQSDRGFFYIVEDDTFAITVPYENYYMEGDVVIPSTLGGYPVREIGSCTFRDCVYLKSVEIPDGVASIGNDVFYDCISLTRLKIPDSVVTIGSYAFAYCESLTNITIPQCVTSIPSCAFTFCTSLTNVTIPTNVTLIGYRAFSSCDSLTSVTITDSVTRIQERAFYLCPSLKDVYYGGTKEQWNNIIVEDGNQSLINATIHCLGEPADYTAVEEALAKVPADLTIYTAETVQAVTDAINAVVYDLTIDKQATIDGYAKAIEDAVASLEIPGVIKVSDSLVNYRLRCTTKVVDGNLVLTATTAGISSMKVRLGNLPEGATVAMVGTNANASMASGIITVTNPGMKNVNVPMTITAADGAVTEFVLVADFGNAIRYATYARLSQTGNNITVTSGAATAYVLFDTTEIDGGYVEVENVSRNLLGRHVVSENSIRFYNPVYDNGTVTVNVKNGYGETVATYNVTVMFADATEYTAVLDTSLRCTYEVDGDNINVTANAGVSNVYLNFGRYYSESLSASVNDDIIKKMGARSWRIMQSAEPVEFDLYFDATSYCAEKVTRHVTVNF